MANFLNPASESKLVRRIVNEDEPSILVLPGKSSVQKNTAKNRMLCKPRDSVVAIIRLLDNISDINNARVHRS